MRFGVVLGRRFRVFQRVKLVSMRNVGVVTGGDVITRFMVLGRFAMMMRRVLQMLCDLVVVVMGRMLFAHWFLLGSQ